MSSTPQPDGTLYKVEPPDGNLRRESERLKLLLDMTNMLVSNLEPRDLLRAISASIQQSIHCDTVAVWFPDAEQRQLRSVTMEFPESRGFLKEDLLLPIEGNGVGEAFKTGRPFVTTSVGSTSGLAYHFALSEGIASGCCLPLISHDRKLGVLSLGWRVENTSSPKILSF